MAEETKRLDELIEELKGIIDGFKLRGIVPNEDIPLIDMDRKIDTISVGQELVLQDTNEIKKSTSEDIASSGLTNNKEVKMFFNEITKTTRIVIDISKKLEILNDTISNNIGESNQQNSTIISNNQSSNTINQGQLKINLNDVIMEVNQNQEKIAMYLQRF